MKRWLWRWIWRSGLVLLGLLFIYQGWIFAQVVWWTWFNPSSSSFMRQRLEVLQERNPNAKLSHKWIPYDKISVNLKRALIAAEDANFMEHEGFDWDAIQKAYDKNLKKGKIVAGGSTISQQLAKNLFLSGRRSPWRKAEEAIITVMIEAVMSKRRIFEIYLNIIEWGEGVFGAEAASQHYFKKNAAALNAWEAARLAAMVPKPRYYDRHRDTPWLERKTNLILERMPSAQVP
ncbi:MAG TPA: monofunctional biosynthetic peptidoglycan transglycosylase [Burkholderiales bacterium]|nr:monofunctional biosynthetic peptidoglycan transglycosylase [Burkholderiales bacterium]